MYSPRAQQNESATGRERCGKIVPLNLTVNTSGVWCRPERGRTRRRKKVHLVGLLAVTSRSVMYLSQFYQRGKRGFGRGMRVSFTVKRTFGMIREEFSVRVVRDSPVCLSAPPSAALKPAAEPWKRLFLPLRLSPPRSRLSALSDSSRDRLFETIFHPRK